MHLAFLRALNLSCLLMARLLAFRVLIHFEKTLLRRANECLLCADVIIKMLKRCKFLNIVRLNV